MCHSTIFAASISQHDRKETMELKLKTCPVTYTLEKAVVSQLVLVMALDHRRVCRGMARSRRRQKGLKGM